MIGWNKKYFLAQRKMDEQQAICDVSFFCCLRHMQHKCIGGKSLCPLFNFKGHSSVSHNTYYALYGVRKIGIEKPEGYIHPSML
jgi:hypothetical protein